jgi:hypothetical protein
MRTTSAALCFLALALATAACASGPQPQAFDNEVFYAYDQVSSETLSRFEAPYPPFDKPDREPGYIGVQVIRGHVKLSRPRNWIIRSASNRPHERFIEYASPNQYVVTIYERLESPWDPWRVVLEHYEKDLEDTGAKALGKAVPVASFYSQGRAYVVERPVMAPKTPLVAYSREYLMRGEHRIVLVQIVHPRQNIEPIADELIRVVDTIKVD